MTSRHSRSCVAFGVAVLVHGLLLAGLFWSEPPQKPRKVRRPPVRIRLVNRAKRPEVKPAVPSMKAKPKPEPRELARPVPPVKPKPVVTKSKQPKRVARSKAKRRHKRRVARRRRPRPKRQSSAKTTIRPQPQAKVAQVLPRKFEVNMEVTVPSGGVAVPVTSAGSGATMGAVGGVPNGSGLQRSDTPEEPEVVHVTAVSVGPQLVAKPSVAEMRSAYPKGARVEAIEGNVRLRILVGASGKVLRVRLVQRAGHGFDEVAVRLVKRFRFRPARRAGRAVPVWIPWTYKFRLES